MYIYIFTDCNKYLLNWTRVLNAKVRFVKQIICVRKSFRYNFLLLKYYYLSKSVEILINNFIAVSSPGMRKTIYLCLLKADYNILPTNFIKNSRKKVVVIFHFIDYICIIQYIRFKGNISSEKYSLLTTGHSLLPTLHWTKFALIEYLQ